MFLTNLGHDTLIFGITSSADVIKHYKAKDGQAVIFKKFDESRAEFDGDFKAVAF